METHKSSEIMTLGEKLADSVAKVLGSWKFIGIQLTLIFLWVLFNSSSKSKIDEYPYSFLNLILGIQSAMTGPILLISGNRQEKLDRKRSIENLELDRRDHDNLVKLTQLTNHIDEHFSLLNDKIDKLSKPPKKWRF